MSETCSCKTNRDKAKDELEEVCEAYNYMMVQVKADPTQLGLHVANLADITKRLIDAVGYLAYEESDTENSKE